LVQVNDTDNAALSIIHAMNYKIKLNTLAFK